MGGGSGGGSESSQAYTEGDKHPPRRCGMATATAAVVSKMGQKRRPREQAGEPGRGGAADREGGREGSDGKGEGRGEEAGELFARRRVAGAKIKAVRKTVVSR